MLAANFNVAQVVWSMLWFFLFFIWIMLLFRVFADIFRDRDMGGGAKAVWSIFVILMPYLGVFVYIIVRGKKMAENELASMKAQEDAARSYIQSVAGSAPSTADELARLADLRDRGVLSDEEFAAAKSKLIG